MQKPYNIIIADDDDDDQFIIKEAFKEISKNIKITPVINGVKLLELLEKGQSKSESEAIPDVIILDINMPLMNGFETLEKIKKSQKLKKIPVVMLSTLRTIDRVDKSLKLGALNYYSKPNQLKDYVPIFKEILDSTIYSENRY